jgi:acyl-CoA hydrolase
VVIAEVNERVPFTFGDAFLPASRIDVRIDTSRAVLEVPSSAITPVEQAIARHVAGFIDDGAVLQTGVGAIPDAVLQLLGDRRDLGVHSGMIGDGLVDLAERGVITNARKRFDAGISICGMLIGTRRLYEFAHRNPALKLCAAEYTHGTAALSRLEKFVTINSAVEVDLTGQVNAEQVGDDYLGGVGGQADYVRAGSRSPGGHSIIALPATARGGASRICARLSGPVTSARSDADVIVTEYGAAELRGQPLAERARRMVRIAHPDAREALERDAAAIARRGF